MDNEQGWKRLGAAVKKRRDDKGWSQLDVAAHGGPSIDRIQAIEGVRTDRYSSRTFSKLERALEWELGSCRAILDGGEPTPVAGLRDSGRAADEMAVRREPSLSEVMDRMTALAEEVKELRQRDEERERQIAEEIERLRRQQSG